MDENVYPTDLHQLAMDAVADIDSGVDHPTDIIARTLLKAVASNHYKGTLSERNRRKKASVRAMRAEAEVLRLTVALEAAALWHEGQDKSLSKQPNANVGLNGWMRAEHQEQSAALRGALASKPHIETGATE